MAVIPMKQTVTASRKTENAWGESVSTVATTHNVRVDEKSEVVSNQAGEEVVSSLTIHFDKLADISYNDTIKYTNEIGVTVERIPLKISVIRGIGGKPIMTRVNV